MNTRFCRYIILPLSIVFLSPLVRYGVVRADEPGIDECLTQATKAQRAGDLAGAESILLGCLLQNADNPRLLARLSLARLAKDDLDGALQACEGSLKNGLGGANKRKIRNICRDLDIVRTTRLRIELSVFADIYVGSKSSGPRCKAAGACEIGRYPGDVRVYVDRDGFEPIDERVSVRENRVTHVKWTLVEEDSPLSVTVEPADGRLKLDGVDVQQDQLPRAVAPGEHSLEVQSDGMQPQTETFTAREGKPVSLDIKLKPVVVTRLVPVEMTPADAALSLNGQPVKLKDGKLEIDPRLENRLSARRDGYRSSHVVIAAGPAPDFMAVIHLAAVPAVTDESVEQPSRSWAMGKHAVVWALAGLSGLSLAGSIGLTIDARGRWADAAKQLAVDATRGEFSDEAMRQRDEARARTAHADYVLTGSAACALGALVAVNTGAGSFRLDGISVRKLSIGAAGALGVVGLAVGGTYAWYARNERAHANIWASAEADETYGQILDTRASDMKRRAVLGFAVAAASAGVAGYLWLATPTRGRDKVSVMPSMVPGNVGLAATGRF